MSINERPEWGDWDKLFDEVAFHIEHVVGPAAEQLAKAIFDIVPLVLLLYRRWNITTEVHIAFRLQRELKHADGDKAKALVRALLARLKSVHMRRHLNDYTTDMRGSVLYLNHLLDVDAANQWLPETSPLEKEEVLRKMISLGGDVPVECIGILRSHWDQVKPKVTKPPSDDDDEDILPPVVPSDEAEQRKIMHHLRLRAKRSQTIATLADIPFSERGFVLLCAFPKGKDADEQIRCFPVDEKEAMQMIRILTAQ